MDWSKYLTIPTNKYITAKEAGFAPAALMSMGKKNLVEVKEGNPNTYRRINSVAAKLYYLCDLHADKYGEYFTVYKDNPNYGMFCSIINNTISDCWGHPYDLTGCTIVKFRQYRFNVLTGKEIV